MPLSLTRTAGESIVLETRDSQQIAVTLKRIEVTAAGSRTARIEVDAPADVTIRRGEVRKGEALQQARHARARRDSPS